MELTDKIVKKVYAGKEIEGKGKFYNFYLVGEEEKFGYFVKKGAIPPAEGMAISYLEWEITESGGYVNNKVKTLVFDETPKSQPQSAPQASRPDDKGIWFCVSYMKDVRNAIIATMPWEESSKIDLKSEALKIAESAIVLFDRIHQIRNDSIPH